MNLEAEDWQTLDRKYITYKLGNISYKITN